MPDQPRYDLFAACAPGFERVVVAELRSLGISNPQPVAGGVNFNGFLSHVYRVNLWSRTTERVLLRLRTFRALTFRELHRKAARMPWEEFISPGSDIAVRATSHKSRLIHSGGIVERVALGIGDRLGRPASVVPTDEENKLARSAFVVVRLVHDECTINLDTSGALLHFRGYRQATAKAPLRETLAASMLLASGWTPEVSLLDPFCGSGTLPIEAALIARHIAPGRRRQFAFMQWPNFDQAAWDELLAKADGVTRASAPSSIQGSDRDAGAIEASRSNARRARVLNDIEFSQRAVSAIEPVGCGWVVTNLPYGKRVGEAGDLRDLYAQFGNVLRQQCQGWHVALLAGSQQLERSTGLRFGPAIWISNGGIKVRFAQAQVPVANQIGR